MQSNSTPFSPIPFLFNGDLSSEGGGFEGTRVLLFASLLFSQGVGAGVGGGSGSGIGMDLSKVGEKILSSVRSARSLGLLPSTPDLPQVPARAVAAAAVARALAGIPPHKRQSLASSSAELSSIYGSTPHGEVVEELEEDFYEEEFDPVGFVLEHIPSEDSDAGYFEEKAAVRLAQLDRITERLSHHVMEHHEEMVKGMQLVRELEKDLKVANVICMNGRRHLTSSMNEVSRDLVVPTRSKKKQFLLDMLPILAELRHAVDMQVTLESHVDEGNFFKAFQVLSEYLQILDSLSELSAIKEMSRGVEVWLGKTLQKLDSLLLGVCQDFKEDGYITVIDAYAIIGDVSGLAEKIQSFFMQEVLSETHSVLRNVLQEDLENSNPQTSRLTYSDLCHHIPESKFRQCLLTTLSVLFNLMSSYYAIMSFRPEDKLSACLTPDVRQKQVDSSNSCSSSPNVDDVPSSECLDKVHTSSSANSATDTSDSTCLESNELVDQSRDGGREASSSGSPWFQLRKDATDFVSQTLHRGCKNLWQLTASRLSVLLSSSAVCSSSIHQFLKNYEDLNIFIVAGEAFCGAEAVEFRQKLKAVCENYFVAFHKQNIHALKMVLEKEIWLKLPPETIQSVSFAGLLGDGAPLFVPSDRNSLNSKGLHANKSADSVKVGVEKSEFSDWVGSGNPFMMKLNLKECSDSVAVNVKESGEPDGKIVDNPSNKLSHNNDSNHVNGNSPLSEDENEDLHADFIDEDSQLPSRIYKPKHRKNSLSHFNDEEMTAQTGSSLCLLRLMDKYARLMQKLEIVNVDFFKGISQLFGIFFHFVFETFGDQNTHPSGKGSADALSYRLKTALSRISQDCDQWIKPQSISFSSSPTSTNAPLSHMDVTPTSPHSAGFIYPPGTSFGLKERCAAADTISLVARVLHRSKAHLQSALVQNNAAVVEDFYSNLVESVTDLTLHIHRTTARILLHVNGYVDRIANAKWEVKDLGLEHNGYVDLLLGEFKHYKTRLSHGGLQKEVQDFLLDYGVDIVAETLVEGISRVRKCSDEGRVLMSLDLQVLINGLQHFVPAKVKPKLQIVETFIKAYYLPETEFVHWARTHPEYSKSQIIGLITLVATVKGWKRKTRLEVLEKIEGA